MTIPTGGEKGLPEVESSLAIALNKIPKFRASPSASDERKSVLKPIFLSSDTAVKQASRLLPITILWTSSNAASSSFGVWSLFFCLCLSRRGFFVFDGRIVDIWFTSFIFWNKAFLGVVWLVKSAETDANYHELVWKRTLIHHEM
jgi:hypothetical protein